MINVNLKKLFFVGMMSLTLLALPIFPVQATSDDLTPPPPNTTPPPPNTTPPPAGSCANYDRPSDTLCNPLPDNNIQGLIIRLLKYLMSIIAMVAVVAIVISGFRMVVSGGDEKAVSGAKRMATWSVIGLIVASLAYSIIAVTQNILTRN